MSIPIVGGQIRVAVEQGIRFLLEPEGPSGREVYTVLSVEPPGEYVSIYPLVRKSDWFAPQFSQIREIRIPSSMTGLDLDDIESVEPESLVDYESDGLARVPGLPSYLGDILEYGLGFPRKYRGLALMIEDHTDCSVVEIASAASEGVDGETFRVNHSTLTTYAKLVNRNLSRGSTVVRRVTHADTHNLLVPALGLDLAVPKLGRKAIIQEMTRAVSDSVPLTSPERKALVARTVEEARHIAEDAPGELATLRGEIELVSLEVLIERFEASLVGRMSGSEQHWQSFFEQNPFALQQLFSAPVLLFGTQINVAVPSLHGTGERRVDFLLLNSLTQSAHVVELKTAATGLVGRAYRGVDLAEVHPPHSALVGAVAQLQAQMDSARRDLETITSRTAGGPRVETADIRGVVIAGCLASLNAQEQRSFLLYRRGLLGVEVITFDEVLARLHTLREMLDQRAKTGADGVSG